MDELQIRAKLHSMWTPEMFDVFEDNLRNLFQGVEMPEAEKEKMIADVRQRAMAGVLPRW
jgi:hypothetical protein